MNRAWCTAFLLAAACASVGRTNADARFAQADVIDVFVRWREGERRRSAEMAGSALYFESAADREFHAKDLEALSTVFAGPIRTAREIHLVGAPDPLGPGDYLFLEPAGGGYTATFVTIVAVRGEPRVLYRRPPVSERDRLVMEPAAAERAVVADRTAFWESLSGEALAAEVERAKRLLRYEVEAERRAREKGIAIAPFEPPPAEVLAALEPLGPEAARAEILSLLRAGQGSSGKVLGARVGPVDVESQARAPEAFAGDALREQERGASSSRARTAAPRRRITGRRAGRGFRTARGGEARAAPR